MCVCVQDFERNSQGQYKHTQVFGDWVHQPVTCTVAIPQRNPLSLSFSSPKYLSTTTTTSTKSLLLFLVPEELLMPGVSL